MTRPSILTLYVASTPILKSKAFSSIRAPCHGWFSTVFDIHIRIVVYFFTAPCKDSSWSSFFLIMTASSFLSTSRKRLYCCTPSPTMSSSTPSGIFLSVGFSERLLAIACCSATRLAVSRCCSSTMLTGFCICEAWEVLIGPKILRSSREVYIRV